MAAIDPLRLRCPACETWIECPVTVTKGVRSGVNTWDLGVSVDPQPLADHAAEHHQPEGGE